MGLYEALCTRFCIRRIALFAGLKALRFEVLGGNTPIYLQNPNTPHTQWGLSGIEGVGIFLMM
jgi:hypothetical protein